MNLEVDAVNHERIYNAMISRLSGHRKAPDSKTEITEKEIADIIKNNEPEIDLESMKNELSQVMKDMNLINKKIKLSFNDDINRIIITIMEKDSNKVIKQFPSVELQNLALHMKRAIGLLFDNLA